MGLEEGINDKNISWYLIYSNRRRINFLPHILYIFFNLIQALVKIKHPLGFLSYTAFIQYNDFYYFREKSKGTNIYNSTKTSVDFVHAEQSHAEIVL